MEEEIKSVWFEDGHICVLTNKGETLSQPLEVFPALLLATPEQREAYKIWGRNQSIRWEELDEDIHISHFHEHESVNYDNEVNHLLSLSPWLDLKSFAKYLGMHWTKLARYKYGVWTPSQAVLAKIKNGILAINKEMANATL